MTFDVARPDHRRQDDAQIVPFRPRTSATAPGRIAPAAEACESHDAPDDFRHRMWMNLAGLICALLLAACGIWLAVRIADVRQTQDCVLSGRSRCAPIVPVDSQAGPIRQH